jgi:hypothetical protein
VKKGEIVPLSVGYISDTETFMIRHIFFLLLKLVMDVSFFFLLWHVIHDLYHSSHSLVPFRWDHKWRYDPVTAAVIGLNLALKATLRLLQRVTKEGAVYYYYYYYYYSLNYSSVILI